MGPIFGSRQVAREVGIHCYDDDEKEWVMAFEADKLIGWLSVRGRLVSDCYVIPSARHDGVFDSLLEYTVRHMGGGLWANCTAASVRGFEKAGFVKVSATKNFTKMEQHHA